MPAKIKEEGETLPDELKYGEEKPNKSDKTGPKIIWWQTLWVRIEKDAEEDSRLAKTTTINT